jgi:hypothetical protein
MSFSFVKLFMPNRYIIERFEWAFTFMDFMGFSFRIFKVISPYHLATKKFSIGFDLVLRDFRSDGNI